MLLLASQQIKKYKIKGQVHALPENVAQNILSWYQILLDSAQKFYSNSVGLVTKRHTVQVRKDGLWSQN